MPFQFCPQCGTKLQPGFRFCPSCGEKLPCAVDESGPVSSTHSLSLSPPKRDEARSLSLSPPKRDEARSLSLSPPKRDEARSLSLSPPKRDEAAPSVVKSSLASSASCDPAATSATPRPALRKTRKSLKFSIIDAPPAAVPSPSPVRDDRVKDDGVGLAGAPSKQHNVFFKLDIGAQPALESSPVLKSPRPARGKAKLSSPAKHVEEGTRLTTRRKAEEPAVDGSLVAASSPVSSPISKSPFKATGRSKAKKAKYVSAVEALQEGEEVTDTTGKKWKLVKLLSQSTTELTYEVLQTFSGSCSKGSNHILKLGAKDGRIFNEQNFLQRAVKPASVDKWIKQNKMDFLGIPSCVGFGLHESYRFLIFPNMGQSLQSVMEEEDELLSEKVVLQLACRILDALQYIHSNEYVHADINAENIYIKPGEKSQVYLAGYCHAFRYCPSGQHVEYREASRTLHEGNMEFISLDAHKGAAPSRRSDLQSLGYCMLRWHMGSLPWTLLTQPDQVAMQKQRYMEDVPALLSHSSGQKGVSAVFQTYLTEVMSLQYSEQPDYSALKAALSAAVLQLGGSP